MGCHTWFMIPVEPPEWSKEDPKERCLKSITKNIDYFKSRLNNTLPKKDWVYSFTNEEVKKQIQLLKRLYKQASQINASKEEWWDNALDRIKDGTDSILLRYNIKTNLWYDNCKEFHDVFRQFGYSEVILKSFEEAWEYYLNSDNKCVADFYWDGTKCVIIYAGENEELDMEVLSKLHAFFDKYPNGYIEFG